MIIENNIYAGMTLKEVSKKLQVYNEFSIYVLQDENDTSGKEIRHATNLRAYLRHNPQYESSVVLYSNDYHGCTVLRIREDR